MKRKRITRTPEEIEEERILHEQVEARIALIDRQTGTSRDRWTVAERMAMIEAELAAKRKPA